MSTRGVLYVSTGPEHTREALRSIRRVKSVAPSVPVSLATDRDVDETLLDTVLPIDDPNYSIEDKVKNLLRTPYDRTLYLDSDTYVVQGDAIRDLFDLLDGFALAVSHDPFRRLEQGHEAPNEELPTVPVPDSFAWFNTGVIAFERTERVEAAFAEWREAVKRHAETMAKPMDQASFQRIVFEGDVRVAVLPPEYNYQVYYPRTLVDEPKVLHGHARNLPEIATHLTSLKTGDDRRSYPERLRFATIEGDGYTRLLPLRLGPWRARYERLKFSLERRGVRRTVRGLLKVPFGKEFWRSNRAE